jgi:hypothetical protein
MTPEWPRIYQDAHDKSQLALEGQLRPDASPTQVRENVAYLLAIDVAEDVGATLFAVLNAYPDIASGMWCLAFMFRRSPNGWVEASEVGGSTAADPFSRPTEVQNSTLPWVDWLLPGGAGWSDEHGWSHLLWGIAPTATHRLTIQSAGKPERDLQITPFSGAFVVAVPSASSVLSGYDQAGRRIGTMTKPERLAPDAP